MHTLITRYSFNQTICLILFLFTNSAFSQRYWQQQVNFNINVSLNDVAHTLEGNETITYQNNSPDTLHFIWFHLWPNAYKNDRTAYSEQQVNLLGKTAFYFSAPEDKGYINKLSFKVNGQTARLEDSSLIEIAKLILPQPLIPGDSISIATPFHVKVPKNFSDNGHIDQTYQFTHWYPKPAVYDNTGWHPMPYLEQGGTYQEFGNYKVAITLPENYVIAGTGNLMEESERQFLASRNKSVEASPFRRAKRDIFKKQTNHSEQLPPSSKETKTIHYTTQNTTNFTWYADKRFIVWHDTINLDGQSPLDVYLFTLPEKRESFERSMLFTKRAVHFYSSYFGSYPYQSVNLVLGLPTISQEEPYEDRFPLLKASETNKKNFDLEIAHRIGQIWFREILCSNGRNHPWMTEGMNTYFERKYRRAFYPVDSSSRKAGLSRPLVTHPGETTLTLAIDTKTDQPIETASDSLTRQNYLVSVPTKTALWLENMERQIGTSTMEDILQEYYRKWQFKHPHPNDFKQVVDSMTGNVAEPLFTLLDQEGSMSSSKHSNRKRVAFLYPTLNPNQQTITILPAVGVNAYDKFQFGFLAHNYSIPFTKFHFALAPLYATGSKRLNFIGNANYTFYTSKRIERIVPSITTARFSTDDGVGEDYQKLYKGFFKIAPSIRIDFRKRFPTSKLTQWIEWKSFFISEGKFAFAPRRPPQDFEYFALKGKSLFSTVHEVSAGVQNTRSLYPYDAVVSVQKAGDLIRTTITGNYYFNYNQHQGANIRFFAGKIVFLKAATTTVLTDNDRYLLNMYGNVNSLYGTQDYTYSNVFIERNQNTNLAGRQIMIRDGGFKYRTDYISELGRSASWLAALNFRFDIPHSINPLSILPVRIPLKIFADVGTFAEAWQGDNSANRFLYSIGLQLPILKYLNVYTVIMQSHAFKDALLTNGSSWWQRRLTFSFDVQDLEHKFKLKSYW